MSTENSNTKHPYTIDSVSGSITIYDHKYTSARLVVKANINFFETPVIFEFNEEYISIRKPDIDYNGRTVKMNKQNSGWYGTTFSKKLPNGKFIFDEDESNEDELIAYYG